MGPSKTWILAAIAVGYLSYAHVPQSEAQVLPSLGNTDLRVDVTFDPLTKVYSYSYTLVSGPENVGDIHMLTIAVDTDGPTAAALDPDLASDASFTRGNAAPSRTVPIGLKSPPGWKVGISVDGRAGWGSGFEGIDIAPGTSFGGFVILSKAPPGPRKFEIVPDLPLGDPTVFPEDCEIRPDCRKPESFNVTGQTIGPVLASELKLIDGKGQRPTDVNTFLKYSNPTAVSTTLPPGVRKFDLAVFYGPTTVPTTFTAELNGVAITPKFHPTPGSFDVVRLDLQPGSNTLILSVEGTRSDGRRGRDTDRLTFSVPTR